MTELLQNEQHAATLQLGGALTSTDAFEAVNDAFGFQAVVLLDSRGDVLAVAPPSAKLIGTNIASRYPHLASAVAGHAAVSNLALSAALGIPVVAFATPFTASDGARRVYSGAYEVGDTPLANYLANAIPYAGHQGFLLDANGDIVTSSPSLSESTIHSLTKVDPTLGAASRPNRIGTIGHRPDLLRERSVPGTPWRVVVTVPTASLFAALSGAALWVPWVLTHCSPLDSRRACSSSSDISTAETARPAASRPRPSLASGQPDRTSSIAGISTSSSPHS